MGAASLTDIEFDAVADMIYARTGMRFGDTRRSYVEKRVLERVRVRGAGSVRNYLVMLLNDSTGRDLQDLVNSLTVNETYFFRESYQLDCLTKQILPEVLQESGRKDIRIWSIPCSTGEEPYSIALTLLESFPGVDDYEIEIFGSDVDTHALQSCVEAVYPERSLRNVPPAVRARYFERKSDYLWQVCQGLRDSVTFTHCSLVNRQEMTKFSRFDVIFCKNVLIYFDTISRRTAAENLFNALRPGGFICLGHSESMARICSSFRVKRFKDAIVYQRPGPNG